MSCFLFELQVNKFFNIIFIFFVFFSISDTAFGANENSMYPILRFLGLVNPKGSPFLFFHFFN